jgi:hypothetical protein
VELILCRTANADAIAAHPTATLFLPRWEFFSLVQEHPALLPGMYMAAVRRHAETKLALEAAYVVVTDGYALDESTGHPAEVYPRPSIDDLGAVAATRRPPVGRIPGEHLVAAELAAQIESTEFPVRASVSARRGGPAASRVSSIAPTSASVFPAAASEVRRPRRAWHAWLATGGAAALAAAASVAVVMWSTQGRFVGRSGAASAGGATESRSSPDTTTAATPAPTSTAATALPATSIAATVATLSPVRSAAPRARPLPAARPAPASAPANLATATPSTVANSPLPTPSASASVAAAPEATGPGRPPSGPQTAARAASSAADEFGGRN